jgi:hypothetical protein
MLGLMEPTDQGDMYIATGAVEPWWSHQILRKETHHVLRTISSNKNTIWSTNIAIENGHL